MDGLTIHDSLNQEQQTSLIFCYKMCRSLWIKQDVIFKDISRNDNPADILTLGDLYRGNQAHHGGN